MRRFAILLALLLAAAAPASAQIRAAPGFDQALAAQVFSSALAFLAPRTLDPVGVPQLAAWGLGGIAAIDPSLDARLAGGQVVLEGAPGTLFAAKPPAADDMRGWGEVLAAVIAAGWNASPAIRGAGTQGAIVSVFDEMFNHLDPYSRYVRPDAARTDREQRFGAGGPGLRLARQGGRIVVSSVTDGGPADRAGIAPGDVLLAVDAHGLRGRDARDVAALLAGAPGTPVRLLVAADGRRRLVPLVREMLPPETVFTDRDGALLVVRIAGFASDTAEQMSEELETALRRGRPSALVLDLRGDRGGLLRQAVTAVALLLDSGLVVTTEGRDPAASHVWRVQGGDLTDGLPIVVLVDGRTASAAEIVAAALADNGRAVVVGSATLGKGLVQTVATMPGGGELFVTWSRVLAPDGWPLQGLGVLPQLCTSQGEATMRAALGALAAGRQPLAAALAAERNARPPIPVARQLEVRDACPAAIGTSLDMVAAEYLARNSVAYRTALLARPPR